MSPVRAIALTRFDMVRGQLFDRHVHEAHQLAWASSGVLMVEIADHCWLLPTALALWIPGGTWHATGAVRASVMQRIHLDPALSPLAWPEPTVVAVAPLARHLIEYLAGDVSDEARRHAECVLLDVLQPVDRSTIELPLPRDRRARDLAKTLMADPADTRNLAELARTVGSSPRTLLRLFLAETGLTFSQWRSQARLQAAIPYLADGQPVARVAARAGYATASAFVAAFRRATGQTPAAYFKAGPAGPAGRPRAV